MFLLPFVCYSLPQIAVFASVRSLPSEEYLATVDDENTGCITCLSCTETTSDKVTLHRMCSGGLELKVWDQLPRSKVKKRARLVLPGLNAIKISNSCFMSLQTH